MQAISHDNLILTERFAAKIRRKRAAVDID